MQARLVLQDGRVFHGTAVTRLPDVLAGQVALYTGVVGYQEAITDPANAGKILVFTYPLIGNYGTNPAFNESDRCWPAAVVVRSVSRMASNWQSRQAFSEWLADNGVPCVEGVDTRTLAVHLREHGEMDAVLAAGPTPDDGALAIQASQTHHRSYLRDASTPTLRRYEPDGGLTREVAVLDLGLRRSLIAQLTGMGCAVTVCPFNARADALLEHGRDGVIVSGGPEGDPELASVAETVRAVLGKRPVFAYGTGHQVVAMAVGARMGDLKLGHRGVNHPVREPGGRRGEITAQNHRRHVLADSLPPSLEADLVSLNDGTVEGIRSKELRFRSIQFEPLSPGMGEPNRFLAEFVRSAA